VPLSLLQKSGMTIIDMMGVATENVKVYPYTISHGCGLDHRTARILATLSVVQSRLAFLESENSVSRRRVKELELELEACKKEVANEKTRILALEMEDVERQRAASMKAHSDRKGKTKEYISSWEGPSRYKEAVEEKKGTCFLQLQTKN
jgi:hypothetical protein